MPRNINVQKVDLPETKPWLTVEFYKNNGSKGFDFKLNTAELSDHQKEIIIESENLVCKWLTISKKEFNKSLTKKLEEEYPQLKDVHKNMEKQEML